MAEKYKHDRNIEHEIIGLVDGDLDAVVAAGTLRTSTDDKDYSTVMFIGGYGAASYQYANETTY